MRDKDTPDAKGKGRQHTTGTTERERERDNEGKERLISARKLPRLLLFPQQ